MSMTYVEPSFDTIRQTIDASGAVYSPDLLRRYHLSLKTRRFVILSGVSGSGKTLLTRIYADAVQAEYCLVPVAPNWDDQRRPSGLLQPFEQAILRHRFQPVPQAVIAGLQKCDKCRKAARAFSPHSRRNELGSRGILFR